MEKRIDIGAGAMGSDGNKVGTVAYVDVRPPGMQISDIVVSTGAILDRDVVVPLDVVSNVEDDTVYLSIDQDQLKTYPDYIEVNYEQPPTGLEEGRPLILCKPHEARNGGAASGWTVGLRGSFLPGGSWGSN